MPRRIGNMLNKALVITSGVMLFGISTLFGILGRPAEMGLAVVAGALGLAFANIDKISRFKGAGFEAEMREKIEAVVTKEIEPPPVEEDNELSVFRYEGDSNTKKVLQALHNPDYTWRYLSGVRLETGMSKKDVSDALNWLLQNGFVVRSEGSNGTLWSLTEKGRKFYAAAARSKAKA